MDIDNRPPPLLEKDKIIKIIEIFFPDAKIYLFGSYARGDARRGSDIDIAIDDGLPFDILIRRQIVNMIDALNMVQRVDVVDLQRVPQPMKENILRDGIVWKN